MEHEKKLSPRQLKAIEALMTSKDIQTASETANIGRTTLYRYLGKDDFRHELSKRRAQVLETTACILASSMEYAGTVLIDLLDNKNPSVRLRAVNSLFEHINTFTELVDLVERVRALEEAK
jgi:hypothetical protein